MLLEPHAGLIIWTIITFVLVLLILKAVVWKPLLSALDERENLIKSDLAQAAEAREEAQALLAEHREKLQEAQGEAREIVRQSREAAEKVQQDIVAKAREDAQQTIEQARRSIEAEKSAALEALRREVADMAILAAGEIIGANIDDEKNRNLVDNFIDKIPQNPSQN